MPRGWIRSVLVTVAVIGAFAAVPAGVRAGGLFAGDAGSQAQQRGGAFVAKSDDPTALMHNPAGLVKARRYQIYVGANVVSYSQSFQREGMYEQPTDPPPYDYTGDPYPKVEDSSAPLPVPLLAATQRWRNWGFGEGVIAPQGMPNRDYPEFVDTETTTGIAPSPTRYDAIKQESLIALPSIGAAYRVLDWLDVGARISWGFGAVKATTYTWGLQNPEEDIEKDGRFSVDVSDSFIPAFGLGVLARPTDNLELGLAYNSAMRIQAKGQGTATLGDKLSPLPGIIDEIQPVTGAEAACADGGTGPQDLKACLDAGTAQTVTVGGRYIVRDKNKEEKADIELDVRWENWEQTRRVCKVGPFCDLPVGDIKVTVDGKDMQTGLYLNDSFIRHGFRDVFSVRLGGQVRFGAVTARAGLAYDTAAAPTSWTRLDIDGAARFTTALGGAYEIGRWRIDAGFAAILEADRTVNQVMIANETDVTIREQPDPIQPLDGPANQKYDPINNGTHSSGYLIGILGVTTWF